MVIKTFSENECTDCGYEIPQARLDNVEGVTKCVHCQEKYELENPESFARKAPKSPIGSRDDFKSMIGKQSFGNRTGNH